jgi:hypothetical protein
MKQKWRTDKGSASSLTYTYELRKEEPHDSEIQIDNQYFRNVGLLHDSSGFASRRSGW